MDHAVLITAGTDEILENLGDKLIPAAFAFPLRPREEERFINKTPSSSARLAKPATSRVILKRYISPLSRLTRSRKSHGASGKIFTGIRENWEGGGDGGKLWAE